MKEPTKEAFEFKWDLEMDKPPDEPKKEQKDTEFDFFN